MNVTKERQIVSRNLASKRAESEEVDKAAATDLASVGDSLTLPGLGCGLLASSSGKLL